MYVRDAKNREEVWLLDRIEAMGLDDTAFRSRDYVVAIDEESGAKAGFGRIRIHKGEEDVCELTSVGVIAEWRGQGVGAHVIERLLEYAGDQGFEEVYALTGEGAYFAQFGFRPIAETRLAPALAERLEEKRDGIDPDASPLVIERGEFRMPERLRESFKRASERDKGEDDAERPEDFGIDPETATYKYDTGR